MRMEMTLSFGDRVVNGPSVRFSDAEVRIILEENGYVNFRNEGDCWWCDDMSGHPRRVQHAFGEALKHRLMRLLTS